MSTNHPKIAPIISSIFHLFSLMLLLNTAVTGVLAGEANPLSKQPELKVNSSEQKLVNQENRNKDEDDKRENSRGTDDDNDDDNDNDNDDKNDD
ncbi:hypothetical protein ACE1CI_23805 [Aerosakkonemataceae cyanobacterium BLCC-F50]|uniref:Uncharacterized protein n=1 Tax=Floridaenema flaviceps BLCC-F50 TaxID=3153642 RepID=A0ABV4XWW7_9CYAN